jgi:hypothetical protein
VRGDEDDRHVAAARPLPDEPRGLQPAGVGHLHVEEHDGERVALGEHVAERAVGAAAL